MYAGEEPPVLAHHQRSYYTREGPEEAGLRIAEEALTNYVYQKSLNITGATSRTFKVASCMAPSTELLVVNRFLQ